MGFLVIPEEFLQDFIPGGEERKRSITNFQGERNRREKAEEFR
jgi:predicted ATP-grasp superfamily ATP-dependent carboligase